MLRRLASILPLLAVLGWASNPAAQTFSVYASADDSGADLGPVRVAADQTYDINLWSRGDAGSPTLGFDLLIGATGDIQFDPNATTGLGFAPNGDFVYHLTRTELSGNGGDVASGQTGASRIGTLRALIGPGGGSVEVLGRTYVDTDQTDLFTHSLPPSVLVETDTDGDGIGEGDDNCPHVANADQADRGGIAAMVPDGTGDACQCGDVNDDGGVLINDATILKRAVLGLGPGLTTPLKCNVIGPTDPADADSDGRPDDCAINDATVIKRAILGLGPGIAPVCAPAVGSGP